MSKTEMKVGWTKGPWFADKSGAGIEVRPTRSIHAITILAHDQEANARLISKAPELYEVLKACLPHITKTGEKYCRAKAERLLAEIGGGQ